MRNTSAPRINSRPVLLCTLLLALALPLLAAGPGEEEIMKKNEQRYTSTASILKSLARSKAWGGSVMANCGPRPDGTMPPPFYRGMAEVRDWMKANGESIKGAGPVPESAQANVPVTTRGNFWYLHAVSGHKGKLAVKPGIAVKSVKAARCLRTGEAVNYRWENGTLEILWPVLDSEQPHDVIAVTFL